MRRRFEVCELSHYAFEARSADVHSEMTEEEKLSIFSAPEFLDFVEQSTKIIQRALNDNYDYIRDYTIGAESGTYVRERALLSSTLISTVGKHQKGESRTYARSMTSGMGKIVQSRTSTGPPRLVFSAI